MNKRIVLKPIGFVYNNVPGPRYHDWGDVLSDIVLDEDLSAGLDGIEEYSHILVLFHLSGVTARQRALRKVHPSNRQDFPEVGVFATHSQYRPNPIGVTVARLIERQDNRLRVAGLDTYNGTPVLDIKGYTPNPELDAEARVPDWVTRYRREKRQGETT